jgi:hypothetical protein
MQGECAAMEIMSRETIEITVVLYPEGGLWVAQGLEFDITARGNSPSDASERFNDKVGAELVISIEAGDPTPLSGIEPAPRKFWEMYKQAKLSVVTEEMPFRITDGSASRVRPHIKIFDRVAA